MALQTIRSFYEIEVNENGKKLPKQQRKNNEFFKKYIVSNHPAWDKQGKYPVLILVNI